MTIFDTPFDPFYGSTTGCKVTGPVEHPRLCFKSQWFWVQDMPSRCVRVRCACGRQEDYEIDKVADRYCTCNGKEFLMHERSEWPEFLRTIKNWDDVRTPYEHDHDAGEENCPACDWVKRYRPTTLAEIIK